MSGHSPIPVSRRLLFPSRRLRRTEACLDGHKLRGEINFKNKSGDIPERYCPVEGLLRNMGDWVRISLCIFVFSRTLCWVLDGSFARTGSVF